MRVGDAVLRHIDAFGPVHFLHGRVARDACIRLDDLGHYRGRALGAEGQDLVLRHAELRREIGNRTLESLDGQVLLAVLLDLHKVVEQRARVLALPRYALHHPGCDAPGMKGLRHAC